MALDNTAVLKVGVGHFYTAPVGTALPTDLRNPAGDWTHMGHTSVQDILSASSEGGETTTLRSLQNATLRTTTAARTEAFVMNLLQFDAPALKLYYGSNATVDGSGHVKVPASPVPTEVAWLVIFYDGQTTAGVYAPKASIIRNDDLSIADTENLAQLSVKVTPLQNGANDYAIVWLPPTVILSTATATATRTANAVSAVNVVSGGSGYTSVPAVTFSGGGGTGAAATAVVTGGVVTAINVTNGGSGYTTDPTVAVAAP
jgi:hypothetical protein